MEYGNYKLELNFKTGRFDVYKKGVGFIISCLSRNACEQVIANLQKEDDQYAEIQKEVDRLNDIREIKRYDRDLRIANDNSALESPIAKATRELMGKYK